MRTSFHPQFRPAAGSHCVGAIVTMMALSLTGSAWAQAEITKPRPLQGGSFTIGVVHGVGHYTVEPDGYHVVLTLTKGAEKPVRFEATLADTQSVTLSSPRAEGEQSEQIVVQRRGEELVVTKDVNAPPIEIEE